MSVIKCDICFGNYMSHSLKEHEETQQHLKYSILQYNLEFMQNMDKHNKKFMNDFRKHQEDCVVMFNRINETNSTLFDGIKCLIEQLLTRETDKSAFNFISENTSKINKELVELDEIADRMEKSNKEAKELLNVNIIEDEMPDLELYEEVEY